MFRLNQIKLKPEQTKEDLIHKIGKQLHIRKEEIKEIRIVRRSIDARKKPDVYYIYTVDVSLSHGAEQRILQKKSKFDISIPEHISYHMPSAGDMMMTHRPIVIGSGPAGLVCAYQLAVHGYCPIVLERGECVEDRIKTVETFWSSGILDPESNVQFGEGGAGTFSDGKLNTSIKDKTGRIHEVLKLFVEAGASEEILYTARPHVGTDVLSNIVKNIRSKIISLGGNVYFSSKVEQFHIRNCRLTAVETSDGRVFETEAAVLAIGHSARDTFLQLHQQGIHMTEKPFAVGVRIQHPQSLIDLRNYGIEEHPILGPADYKLQASTSTGRSCYSFCMCPGGYVVNASSEEKMLAVNGMSYHDRDSGVANSAIVVNISPAEYPKLCAEMDRKFTYNADNFASPLTGMEFQRRLERAAYELGSGAIPIQDFGSFATGNNPAFDCSKQILTRFKGKLASSNVSAIFPSSLHSSIVEGIRNFDRKIPGFANQEICIAGVESRTSSPVRMERNESYESNIRGIYPCGEGAGYAGGITSAAVDGLRIAESLISTYAPLQS